VQLRLEGDATTTTDGGGERVDDDEHKYEDERYALKLFSLRNPHPRKKYIFPVGDTDEWPKTPGENGRNR
jgi:hypothetical protein